MTAHKSGQKWIRFMKIPPYRYITYLMLVQITMISYIIKFLFHIICWKEPLWYLRKAFILYKLDRELFLCFKLHSKAQWTKLDSQSGSFFIHWKSQFFFHIPWILKKLQKHCNLHVQRQNNSKMDFSFV